MGRLEKLKRELIEEANKRNLGVLNEQSDKYLLPSDTLVKKVTIQEVKETSSTTIKLKDVKTPIKVTVQGGKIKVGDGNYSVVKIQPNGKDAFCMGIDSISSKDDKLIIYPNVGWAAKTLGYGEIKLSKSDTEEYITKMKEGGERYWKHEQDGATIYVSSMDKTKEFCKDDWSK